LELESVELKSAALADELEEPSAPVQGGILQTPDQVDLLVLSQDADMVEAFTEAVDARHVVHATGSMEEAVAVLERNPVGVVITDRAVDEDAIATLTTQLKRHVPELVTIVASGRSDAQLLIDLINYGQIFRFLLKPLRGGQCRLSVDAAVTKHLDLMADPGLRRRHAVEAPTEPSQDGVFGVVFSRLRKVRNRFFAAGTPA
jgi:DNA-binding NtrC family response regulator